MRVAELNFYVDLHRKPTFTENTNVCWILGPPNMKLAALVVKIFNLSSYSNNEVIKSNTFKNKAATYFDLKNEITTDSRRIQ